QLAAVAGIDETRRVDDRDAVLEGEPAARLHVARVAGRNGHGDTGADTRAVARAENDALTGGEVESRVARVGAPGQDCVWSQPADGELDGQPSSRFRSASAMTKGA